MKDFKPFSLGTIELQPGRGLLTLRALKIPGHQVMDVRALLLTLQPGTTSARQPASLSAK